MNNSTFLNLISALYQGAVRVDSSVMDLLDMIRSEGKPKDSIKWLVLQDAINKSIGIEREVPVLSQLDKVELDALDNSIKLINSGKIKKSDAIQLHRTLLRRGPIEDPDLRLLVELEEEMVNRGWL